ncbi:MAG TPA: hypothetical protein VJA25_04395, partial [Dehalococcoidia bacterium]|nr:hypothetical protein [Dehalococcoidia bacterium]
MILNTIRRSTHSLLRALPKGPGFTSEALAVGLVTAPLLIFYFSPNLAIAALGTILFLLAAWWRLDLGLLAVIVAAPFYRSPKELDLSLMGLLMGRSSPVVAVSLVEYALLVCALAWLLRQAVAPEDEASREDPR